MTPGSWELVSLGDVVDFHALRSARGLVYGWDSGTGRFTVSADLGGQLGRAQQLNDVFPANPKRLDSCNIELDSCILEP